MTTQRLTIAAFIAAVFVLTAVSGPAAAASADPRAVSEWFSAQAVPFIVENSAGEVSAGNSTSVDFSQATHTGTVSEVHAWTSEFIKGGEYSVATSATGDWIASIHAGDRVLGTVTARYTAADDSVEFVAYDDNVELGSALDEVSSKATVVFDGQTASWIALQSTGVVPLTSQGKSLVAQSSSIGDFQKQLANRYADALAGAEGLDDAVGGGAPSFDAESWNSNGAYYLFGGALAAGAGLLAVYVVRRRRLGRAGD